MSWQGCQKLVVEQTSDWPQNSDPPVATGGVFGAYRAVDDGQMSPTPVRFDAFVTQISDMWATEPNWPVDQVTAISVPVAIVAGEYDEAIRRAHTDKMAGLIAGAKLVVLPQVSHFAMLRAPDDYNAAVRAFID